MDDTVGRTLRVLSALSALALTGVAVRRSLLRVQGLSMRPTLRAGDLVVTFPLPPAPTRADAGTDLAWTDLAWTGLAWKVRRSLVRPGGIVVLSEPGARDHLIIKRVTAVLDHGVDVAGDDPGWSIDSRTFGTVAHRDVRRIVLGRVPDGASLRRWVGTLGSLRRSRRSQ